MNFLMFKPYLICLTLIFAAPSFKAFTQENFGVEKDLHHFVLGNYSRGVVEQFMARIDKFNQEHENLGIFY
jgi:hypothetical protein